MSRSQHLLEIARTLVRVRPGSGDRIESRENSRLEFKETFNWGSRAKYAKSMAAFANAEGGFLVFGVKNSPRDIVGVNVDRFDDFDPARASEYLQSTFAPEIEWEMFRMEVNSRQLGVVAVLESRTKPVVCVRNDDNIIKEAEIYYRYRGRTDRIRFPELQALLLKREQQERNEWLKLIQKASAIGAGNIGILDLTSGDLEGSHGRLVISPELLEKVRFIREGRFTESQGEGVPVLRLVGNVEQSRESSTAIRMIPTPIVIGQREILGAFLQQQQPSHPLPYISQMCRESTAILPIFYFAELAGLSRVQLEELVQNSEGHAHVKTSLVARIQRERQIEAIGSLSAESPQAGRRSEFYQEILHGSIPELTRQDDCLRCLEAITHYEPSAVPQFLFEFLGGIVSNRLDGLQSNEKTVFRKVVARLDELLYASRVA